MTGKTLVGAVASYFRDNFKLTSSSPTSLRLNRTSYTSRQFSKKFREMEVEIAAHYGRKEFYSAIEEAAKAKSLTEEKTIENLSDAVFSYILEEIGKANKEKTVGNTDVTKYSYKYHNKAVVIDRKSNDRLIYDNDRKCIDYGSNYDSWKEYRSMQPQPIRELMNASAMVADIYYNPFETWETNLEEINGQKDVLTINAHVTPLWRRQEIQNPVLPQSFVDFMNHLFPDEQSLKYVYNWMNWMLTDRNGTILLLHGGRGIGKNTFALLCRDLVGEENFTFVSSGFFQSRFNGELRNIRLGFFDEHDILSEDMSVWKQLPEKFLTIEDKGLRPQTIQNHASFIVANNFEARVDLLCDERKFSVPIVGTTKVNEAMGQEYFDQLVNDLDDNPEFISNIGWWIIKNGDSGEFNSKKPFVSDVFYEIVEKALTNWQRALIELIEKCEMEEYALSSIEEELNGTGRTKVEKFLASYRDRDGDSYGYVKQKDGDRFIIVAPKYRPMEF